MGEALARGYAAPGQTIAVVGRNGERLAQVAAAVEAKGAKSSQGQVDVTDRAGLEAFVEQFDAEYPIDLVIINAGIFDGRKPGEDIEDLDTSLRVLDTNLTGTLTTLHAVLPGMRRRGRGHIVLMSSLAGLTPIGGGLGYSASKAAVVFYGLGLKQLLHPMGIRVTVACPGFVETPITDRHLGWQPFRISPDAAARKIIRGIQCHRAIVAFPLVLHVMTRVAILMPDFVRRIVGRVFSCHAAAGETKMSGKALPSLAPGE